MPKRDAPRGRYFSPGAEDYQIGWFAEACLAIIFTPWMLIRYLFLPRFVGIEKVVIGAVQSSLASGERSIFDAQIKKVNFVQRSPVGRQIEATFFRWRLFRMQTRRMPKFPFGESSCVLFATVKLGIDDKIFIADIISFDGRISSIICRTNTYDFYKRTDFKLLDVDVEPVEIDDKGKFVKFVR